MSREKIGRGFSRQHVLCSRRIPVHLNALGTCLVCIYEVPIPYQHLPVARILRRIINSPARIFLFTSRPRPGIIHYMGIHTGDYLPPISIGLRADELIVLCGESHVISLSRLICGLNSTKRHVQLSSIVDLVPADFLDAPVELSLCQYSTTNRSMFVTT